MSFLAKAACLPPYNSISLFYLLSYIPIRKDNCQKLFIYIFSCLLFSSSNPSLIFFLSIPVILEFRMIPGP